MKAKILISVFVLLNSLINVYCQDSGYEYFITVNSNVYLPGNTSSKGTYPILWYDKTADPKLMVGGFGIGFSVLKPIKSKITLKGQANISRHAYWDESVGFRTITNQPMGDFSSVTSDYTLGLAGLVHYSLSKRISVGTGLGAQFLFLSRSRMQVPNSNDELKYVNKYYKPVMPVVPLELSVKSKKVLFNIRYEYGLLNRLRGDLAKEQTERFCLLTFEIGFRIK